MNAFAFPKVEPEILPSVDKSAVRQAFSRAAESYDASAAFQRDVGNHLLTLLPDIRESVVLDLGCGTGFFTEKLSEKANTVIALDLSEAMLEKAKARCGGSVQYLSADAECLPLQSESVDIVFSSLAVQWCDDLADVFSEIKRVLKPGGIAVVSTLLDGSLYELKDAWLQVDSGQHVNRFLSESEVLLAFEKAEIRNFDLSNKRFTLSYSSGLSLMRDLKGIGATHLTDGRSRGLSGKAKFRELEAAYGKYRNKDGNLPATYQVGVGVIKSD
ncbi:malonyl-[acyl-carrier protein] O-methyltransferase BioC [Veronia nyctiphanis]|uniref:Malonyl-[acyl-carrier protein] O-methyltransferase n=1 Tax=Veronia nyctiphanis TaxID=1278244 RepID=A0A4Q0YI37_9GAMM|nr:malonyl-ACP O-methyltransferase BioC [Veronia nyctiphanis]RXJ70376.1 malonyl-[acyl-carrier protein] O-methyltransferase BioC [Veronia nyctiphanis]